MPVIPVTDLQDPRLCDYRDIKDADGVKGRGVFIVESRLSVRRFAEGSRFPLRSVFISERLTDLIDELSRLLPDEKPIYTAPMSLMNEVVGFPIHRGCLAAGDVGPEPMLDALLDAKPRGLVVVLEHLSNVDNVGSVFRNAAALGADLVVVDAESCDPLYRRSIRVSVGASLTLPFARVSTAKDALQILRQRGYFTMALTPEPSAETLAKAAQRASSEANVALFVGSEGEGLGESVLASVDLRVRIPMAQGMDSLNVAAATAVALSRLAEARTDPMKN